MPSDDDDDEDGDLNSSGPMSSDRDDHDLSKRDVSFPPHTKAASERESITDISNPNLLSEKPQAPKPQEEEQTEACSGEEGAGGAAAAAAKEGGWR